MDDLGHWPTVTVSIALMFVLAIIISIVEEEDT